MISTKYKWKLHYVNDKYSRTEVYHGTLDAMYSMLYELIKNNGLHYAALFSPNGRTHREWIR